MLPLSVFVALNVNTFGFFMGTSISWFATSLGSFICYMLFYFLEDKFFSKLFNKKFLLKINNGIRAFQNIKFVHLVLIITLPFTPSFLINILSGVAKVSKEKFIFSLLIGKMFTIIFWGYIGKSFIESLGDITSIIYILGTLLFAYIISKIVEKRFHIE